MKVLLTGGSSFTGYWFARALNLAGHHVVAPIRGSIDSYTEGRAVRVAALAEFADIRENVSFGDAAFLELAAGESFDLLAHHAADVTGYRSPDFDVGAALNNNTLNASRVIETLRDNGLKGIVVTGSVFESDAGVGDGAREAFSPYGLSKALSAQVFRYWCQRHGVALGKFNIANPFGVFEEPRFCNFLIRTWVKGETARVNTPLYVRDNIFVDLLAQYYVDYLQSVASGKARSSFGPVGFAETQGAFAQRFANEMRPRLGLECQLELGEQTTFDEPLVRLNTDHVALPQGWSHAQAWDLLADYYRDQIRA
ncbi:NAD-dependent epimerase/dehydratase family protein [Brevundimonas sp.]|uniref:NAD-dependent epimerase/dehydratase family protein n=1 Tax=Brevundimonas sp. TaxID=1871086 RepID=UPI003B006CCA